MTTNLQSNSDQDRVFEIGDQREFQTKFDQQSFMIPHQLADHPLFEFKRLFELARKKKAKGELYWDMGDVEINQRWDEAPERSLSMEQALERIENANAWIILRSVQTDPDYRALLDIGMAQVEELSGIDFQRYVKLKDAIIFWTSPQRITTYHIDRECSMLLQIRGEKTVHVFDRNDREVLPEEEIEKFWTVDNNAPRYREQYQSHAASYRLKPGDSVHIPVNAPHWLKNGEGVSISLNINFHYHDFVRADLYRANYFLRRLGVRPVPPGKSKARDALKRIFLGKPVSFAKAVKSRIPSSK